MDRPPQDDAQEIASDSLEQALAALDQNRPDLVDPSLLEPPAEEMFEADVDSAEAEARSDAKMVRDAFGNRRCVPGTEPSAEGSKNLKVLIEMYSIPPNLARLVLQGKMSVAAARNTMARRQGSDKALASPGVPLRVRVMIGLVALGLVVLLLRLI